jgi:hypothetical protein
MAIPTTMLMTAVLTFEARLTSAAKGHHHRGHGGEPRDPAEEEPWLRRGRREEMGHSGR